MNPPLRYLIQCERMHRTEEVISYNMIDLMQQLERYMLKYGPIVLLYQSGRA